MGLERGKVREQGEAGLILTLWGLLGPKWG